MTHCEDCDSRCDTCGAPITTGFMALLCPRAERCEFWPDDAAGQEFVRQLRADHSPVTSLANSA